MIANSGRSLRTISRFNLVSGRASNRSSGLRAISSLSSSSNLSPTSTSTSASNPLSTSKSFSITTRSLSTNPPNRSFKSTSQSSNRSPTPPAITNSSAVAAAQRAYSSIANDDTTIPSSSFVETTTLPNGVRVATETTPGHFSAVGIYIDAGSRFERTWVPGESGVSHMLDRLAFKSTMTRSAEQMMREIEAIGGNLMCSSSRETIMYQSSVFNQDVPSVVSILSDTILNPIISAEELEAQKESVAYEVSQLTNGPETFLPELLHTTAYQGNTLGNPLLCPLESLEVMTSDHVRNYLNSWYTPDRIVVAGAGMPHEQLVQLTEQFFGHLEKEDSHPKSRESSSSTSSSKPSTSPSSSSSSSRSREASLFGSSSSSTSSSSSSIGSADFSTKVPNPAQHVESSNPLVSSISPSMKQAIATSKAQYTGGEVYLPAPDSEFTHLYVAFESVSIHDPDIYSLATLQILLGGGGSFSAGGPGKGMYSRLYSNVLNQYHSVDYCSSFHHCYNDSGIFGIAISCNHSFVSSISKILAKEFELLMMNGGRGSITENELNRAKNQLKSSLVMALESRLIEVEDLGRQVQVHGFKVSVEEMCDKIDQIDLSGIRRVAERILRPNVKKEGVEMNKGILNIGNSLEKKPLNFGLGNGKTTVVAQGRLDYMGDVRKYLWSRGLGADPKA